MLNKGKIHIPIREYLIIFIGSILYAISTVVFIFPNSLLLGGTGEMDPHHLYVKEWNETLGVEKLGILVFAEKDILGLIRGEKDAAGNRKETIQQ